MVGRIRTSSAATTALTGFGVIQRFPCQQPRDTLAAMIVEIRTYRVVPGELDDFVAAMNGVRPMLARYGIDVVATGPSMTADDGEHAYLIRAFPSIDERERLEESFYGSAEWRDGPRASILDRIESYHTVVLDLPDAAVAGLRQLPSP
jgi:hypothetical protein